MAITQTTNWKRLQRKSFLKGKASPGVAEVIIHPVISTEGLKRKDTESLQNQLRDVINAPLQEMYNLH